MAAGVATAESVEWRGESDREARRGIMHQGS